MKKKFQNFLKMNSNCLYNLKAFAHKIKFPIAPTLFILAMSNWYKMVHGNGNGNGNGNGTSISRSRKYNIICYMYKI